MFTPRKRHLKKKRFFLADQHTYALFNGSNLKASKITELKLFLQKQNANLYSAPLFLKPPKLALGYPLIIVIYNRIEDLQTNLYSISSKFDYLGVSINNKWHSKEYFIKTTKGDLNQEILSLLLSKKEVLK